MSEEAVLDESSHYEISLTASQALTSFVLLLFSLAASFWFGLIVGKGQPGAQLAVKDSGVIREEAPLGLGESVPGIDSSSEFARPLDSEEKVVIDETATLIEERRPEFTSAGEQAPKKQTASKPADDAVAGESQLPASTPSVRVSPAPPNSAPLAAGDSPKVAAGEKIPASGNPRPRLASVAAVPRVTPAATVAAAPEVTKPDARPVVAAAPALKSESAGPVFVQLMSTSDAKSAETLAARVIDGGFSSAYVARSPGKNGVNYRVRVKFASEADARKASEKLKQYSRGEIWLTKH